VLAHRSLCLKRLSAMATEGLLTNNMNTSTERRPDDYSHICVGRCGGLCCDPWWGIIHYSLQTSLNAGKEEALERELLQSLKKREKRIREAYVTKERPPRALFHAPESYSLILRGMKPQGNALRLDLIAVFAFRCRFLSDEKTCTIHPTLDPQGRDIRPPHCARLGTPGARAGEEGYCRIIDAATSNSEDKDEPIDKAIELEKNTSIRYMKEGVAEPELAVQGVLEKVRDYWQKNAQTRLNANKTGRNEPCPCGSGKKFKKCHGK